MISTHTHIHTQTDTDSFALSPRPIVNSINVCGCMLDRSIVINVDFEAFNKTKTSQHMYNAKKKHDVN